VERPRYGKHHFSCALCCLMVGCTAQVFSPNAVSTKTGSCTAPMVASNCEKGNGDVTSDPTPNTTQRRKTSVSRATTDNKQVNLGQGASTTDESPSVPVSE
jgi:hypothetical protein